MAYVLSSLEGGRLTVVGRDGQTTVVAEEARHDGPMAWSPDGGRLLYATGEEDERAEYHMWDAATGQVRHLNREFPELTRRAQRPTEAPWSPDGTRLLFLAPQADGSEADGSEADPARVSYWVLDVEAGQLWRAVQGGRSAPPTWVNTGTLLYEGNPGGGTGALHLVELGPPAVTLTETVGSGGTGGQHALSPDGRYLAGIWTGDGSSPQPQVVPLPGHPPLALPAPPTAAYRGQPLWSPEGRWVAYGAPSEHPAGGERARTVLADTTGLSQTQVITGLLPLAWSPDGRLLAGRACAGPGCGPAVADVVSGHVVTLAQSEGAYLWDLAWSPQGTYLAYSLTGSEAEVDGLALWERATGQRQALMPGQGGSAFTDLQWTPDGCHLAFAQRQARAGETAGASAPVEAVWQVGPDWGHRWRVAPPTESSGPRPCPASPLASRRLIAYYGAPGGAGLGVLGRDDVTPTLELLNAQAQAYRDLEGEEPAVETVPVFHMVTTIADGYAGDDGDYNHRLSHETIRRWIEGIRAAGGWAVLDVQPGRGDLDVELDLIEAFLWQPEVHLAVDPEFMVGQEEVPGERLGHITGRQINQVQARLARIGRATGGRKMLIVHQFDDRMIEGKGDILDYALVDLVWDADGFGGLWAKTEDYRQYSQEPGFEYGGLKLFYDYDTSLMTPEQVLALEPPPTVVIYQ
jgi:hypothetical protein